MNDAEFRQALRQRVRRLNKRLRVNQEHLLTLEDDDKDLRERKLIRGIARLRGWVTPNSEEE